MNHPTTVWAEHFGPVQVVVLPECKYFKIFNSIVEFVAVLVVNHFIIIKRSAKYLCHYMPVFERSMAPNLNHAVSMMNATGPHRGYFGFHWVPGGAPPLVVLLAHSARHVGPCAMAGRVADVTSAHTAMVPHFYWTCQ